MAPIIIMTLNLEGVIEVVLVMKALWGLWSWCLQSEVPSADGGVLIHTQGLVTMTQIFFIGKENMWPTVHNVRLAFKKKIPCRFTVLRSRYVDEDRTHASHTHLSFPPHSGFPHRSSRQEGQTRGWENSRPCSTCICIHHASVFITSFRYSVVEHSTAVRFLSSTSFP